MNGPSPCRASLSNPACDSPRSATVSRVFAWPTMEGARSPVTTTAVAKKTMSRSFLIDSLIGGVKRPAATLAVAAPYHPQLDEYIQFLNRTAAVAAAAYGYQSPTSTPAAAFSSSAVATGQRFFGYPAGNVGGYGKDHLHRLQYQHQQHLQHQHHLQIQRQGRRSPPAVTELEPEDETARPSERDGHRPARKRTADEMTTTSCEPGESNFYFLEI